MTIEKIVSVLMVEHSFQITKSCEAMCDTCSAKSMHSLGVTSNNQELINIDLVQMNKPVVDIVMHLVPRALHF